MVHQHQRRLGNMFSHLCPKLVSLEENAGKWWPMWFSVIPTPLPQAKCKQYRAERSSAEVHSNGKIVPNPIHTKNEHCSLLQDWLWNGKIFSFYSDSSVFWFCLWLTHWLCLQAFLSQTFLHRQRVNRSLLKWTSHRISCCWMGLNPTFL